MPDSFARTILGAFGERGRLFFKALPALIEEASQRWGPSQLRAADLLTYSYVLYARRGARL